MRLEGQSRRSVLVAAVPVVDSVVLASDSKLRPHSDALVVRNLRHVPCRITCWIAIVATLLLILSSVEISVEVQLLSRVVLIYQFGASLEIVYAVLDRVDPAAHRLLAYAHTVAQAPSKKQTIVDIAVAF